MPEKGKEMKTINPRAAAFDILLAIEDGAYTNLALDQYFEGPGRSLTRLDRNFIMELVQGSVRNRRYLDWIVDQKIKRPQDLKTGPRNLLRMAFYQLCFLDKVPAHAVTHETVNLAKRRFHQGVASLMNGVLRSWLRNPEEIHWPDVNEDPETYLSVTYSHPAWMIRAWLNLFGFEKTQELCQYNNQPPELWLRTNTLKTTRKGLMETLEAQGCQVQEGRYAPESVLYQSGPALRQLEAFQQGWFAVQDESSMLVAHGLMPKAGQRVWDTCAAPGGKTTHLAQLMGNQGEILAWDIHPHRVALIEENSRRLGLSIIRGEKGDALAPQGLQEAFDRILVDAPCSGLGVLRRRADARWRKSPQDIVNLQKIQITMLTEALTHLKPGGRLVYSTCTIMPQENEEVVQAVLAQAQGYRLAALPFEEMGLGSESMLQCLPFVHGLEGFFIAAIERTEG